jgi:guanosine-3',5'-bis(diphosphate) 3'-pyrophosphohydrolase
LNAQKFILLEAERFAARRHQGQTRKDAARTPYIEHPRALVHLLRETGGVCDVDVLAAGFLHDVLEDTDTTPKELQTAFGQTITRIVMEVSDDKRLPKIARKFLQVQGAPFASREAKLVKLADKICNLRDILDSPPAGWTLTRKEDYFRWAKSVVDGLRGVNAALEDEFDRVYGRISELSS